MLFTLHFEKGMNQTILPPAKLNSRTDRGF